jgi:4'-phosphopantetheinyl transferase
MILYIYTDYMKIYISDINDYTTEQLILLVHNERRDRSLKYRFEEDTKRSLLAHALLNHALKEEGIIADYPILPVTDERGKPHFYTDDSRTDEIYFSLSHSGRYSVCAIGEYEIGVDIEKIADFKDDISKRFFYPPELKYVHDSNSFYRIWTLKEGYLKAVGMGMALALDSFGVTDLDEETGRCNFVLSDGTLSDLHGCSMITDDGYALSAVSKGTVLLDNLRFLLV